MNKAPLDPIPFYSDTRFGFGIDNDRIRRACEIAAVQTVAIQSYEHTKICLSGYFNTDCQSQSFQLSITSVIESTTDRARVSSSVCFGTEVEIVVIRGSKTVR
jgi:hypothetical protein